MRARAAFGYGGLLQEVISRWKNGREETLGRPLATLMAQQADSLQWTGLEPKGLVVPVPTHWRRLRQRGFHPPGVLASALGQRLELPVLHGALRWTRPVPSSRGQGRRARERRLRGVIQPDGHRLSGRTVLLIDDVMTTGATVQAAARACLRAGAVQVEVAVLARTV